MPYIKSKDIHVTPNRSLRYICDPNKTQNGLNIVSLNCMPDARNAYEDMKRIYEYYSGRKFNEPMTKEGKARVKLIHYVQSFDPKDNVSIDTAQQIALDTVKEMFGENVQAVTATHDDKPHLHTHIMVNVLDLNGKRFHSNQTTLNKLRSISDKVCMEYGVRPFDRENYIRQPIISGHHEWINLKRGTSWKQHIREKIDELALVADSFDNLVRRMVDEGYTFKYGKYISVKAPGQQRFVRLKTLGDNYTPERIEKRIAEQKEQNVIIFSEQYYSIITGIKGTARAYKDTSSVNDTCEFYYRQYQTITKKRLESIGMVQSKLANAKKKYSDIEQAIRELQNKIDTLTEEVKNANHYFDDMGIMQRRFPKKERDKTAVSVIKKYEIKHKEDISALTDKLEKYNSELAELTDKLSSASGEVLKYKEIVDTYDMLHSNEDYISRLVREAKENINSDDWNTMLSEQRKVILIELDAMTPLIMYPIEKQIMDKIAKLSTMNVDPYEIDKLIRVLAVMRIDNITSADDVHCLARKMKASAIAAQKECIDFRQQADELGLPINRADVYVRYKDDPSSHDMDFLNVCKKYAEENDATDSDGYNRLVAKRDDLKKQADGLSRKSYYYQRRAEDYDSILSAIHNINIYPQERKSTEQKKNLPNKKHRR